MEKENSHNTDQWKKRKVPILYNTMYILIKMGKVDP